MPPVIKAYDILLRLLESDAEVMAEVGVRLWAGAVPIDQVRLMPQKAIALWADPGDVSASLAIENKLMQIQCFGATMSLAWDVYAIMAGALRRRFNSSITLFDGDTCYVYRVHEDGTGRDYIEPEVNWPSVLSTWRVSFWEWPIDI